MSSWIGVDLDGTLAHYEGWEVNHNKIGEPVQPMLRRVIEWLNNHQEVRIFTARISSADLPAELGRWGDNPMSEEQ